MARFMAGLLMALLLGGCATRGALRIDCDNFAAFIHPVELSPIERQVRALDFETLPPARRLLAERLARAEIDRMRADEAYLLAASATPRPTLLLSGGGQWGAFGVGLMNTLVENGQFPDFAVVTGVSTGALQSLFVGAGFDQPGELGTGLRAALAQAYSPADEREVVDRGPQFMAAIDGAMANLKPLKRRFEERICPWIYDPNSPLGRAGVCLTRTLRDARHRVVLLGMIEANSGEFGYINVAELLAPFGDGKEDMARATQCLAGAALASAAVPVFYQQVRVDGRTYYDGGVRQSVFLATVAEARREAAELVRQERARLLSAKGRPVSGDDTGEEPGLYVIRNGPTTLPPDEPRYPGASTRLDRKADAINAAARGEAIMVNQLEVGSIAALRLHRPGGPIWFVSADGFENYAPSFGGPRCGAIKDAHKGAMFVPDFMRCVMDYGRNRATGALPWIDLCRYDGSETRPICMGPAGAPPPQVVPRN